MTRNGWARLGGLVLVLATTWAGSSRALPYDAPTRADYPTGSGPQTSTMADVNNDGWPDVITANAFDNSISVLINGGNGIYLSHVDYPAGTTAAGVTAADLNHDGNQDLIVPAKGDDKVGILFGDGTGAFNSKVDYATGSNPIMATLGFLNADSYLDLIVVNRNSSTVSVRLGAAGGTFGPKTDYATGLTPVYAIAVDVNRDNISDVVVANYNSSSISILLGDGSGGLLPKVDIAMTAQVLSVTPGYFNADNIVDLAVARSTQNRVRVLFGNGNGTFTTGPDLITGTMPYSVKAGDINMDGLTDIAVSNQTSATISVFYGSGTGTFAPKVDWTTGGAPTGASILDVTGDGEPDLVTCNQSASSITIRRGNVPGGFAVGDTLIDLTGTDENGAARTISAGNGKWRVVEMCCVWCPTCNIMGSQARQVCDTWTNVHPLPFEYLTLLVEDGDGSASTVSDATKWRNQYNQNSPVLTANGHQQNNLRTWELLKVHAFPTTFIVDPQGKIREKLEGRYDGQDLVDHIAALAGIAPSPTLADPLPPPPPPDPGTPTLAWHALATATAELSYGNSTWSGPLGAPVEGELNARTFYVTPTGVPGIPGTAFFQVNASTDSTSGIESIQILAGSQTNNPIQVAQPWKIRLTSMTWDDGQPRVLEPNVDPINVWTFVPSGDPFNPKFSLAPINPTANYQSNALELTPFTLGTIPDLSASTFGFGMVGMQLKHQFGLVGVTPRGSSLVRLAAPVPNPARNATTLSWSMPRAGLASMVVVNVNGRVVATLHDGAATAGEHTTRWDLGDDFGARVAPGLYFVRLESTGQPERTTRIVVLR